MAPMSPQTDAPETLRVVVIPDSFKGSASASDVAEAMARGARRAAGRRGRPIEVGTLPFADGGEGTLDAICGAWGVTPRTVAVTDALGRPARGRYAVSADGRVGVIEAAEANGLPGVSDVPPRPQDAGTRGVGDLVAAVLDDGCEEILLCIGGSASTDGGAGLLQRLGVRFLDSAGAELAPGGGPLARLAGIDVSGLDPRAARARWRIACDVTNPLTGPRGAAAVFGPQKGATLDDVAALDAALGRLADVLAETTGTDARDEPGMGAAGGLPLTLVGLLGAQIVPGGLLVADVLGAPTLLERADVVFTGEGRFDTQSVHGKVVDTVRGLTPAGIPVFVVAGSVTIDPDDLDAAGIAAAFSIAGGPQTLDELRAAALPRIEIVTEQVLRTYLS